MTAEFITPQVERDVARAAAKPACQGSAVREFPGQVPCATRQTDERALGDLGGNVRGIHLAQRGGIHEIRVPGDEFREGGFRAAFGIFPQELGVGFRLHLTYSITTRRKIRQSF